MKRVLLSRRIFHCLTLGDVNMRKIAPDDFLISYRVYMMTGSFHIFLFNGTFHVDKVHVWFNRKQYACATRSSLPADRFYISHRNGWSFRVYMIPLRDFVPE